MRNDTLEATHQQRMDEWAEREAYRAHLTDLAWEAAKQPVTGPKTITVTFDLDVTGLSDEQIDSLIRPHAQSNTEDLVRGWVESVAKKRKHLEYQAWAEKWAAGSDTFQDVTLETLRERLFDGEKWYSQYATAELARVGTWFHSGAKTRLHVHSVKVQEEHRGKGYGRKLMELLILRADLEGVGLELRVDPANTPAVRLYESLGFVAKAAKPLYSDRGRPPNNETFMVRKRTARITSALAVAA